MYSLNNAANINLQANQPLSWPYLHSHWLAWLKGASDLRHDVRLLAFGHGVDPVVT